MPEGMTLTSEAGVPRQAQGEGPEVAFLRTVGGFAVSQSLYVAAKRGLADL